WLDDGVVLCAASGNQTGPQLVSDGAGGAIVTWQDSRSSGTQASDVYVQRVDGTGASRWTVDGVALCAATGLQRFPRIVSDGAGGAIIALEDHRNAGTYTDIYARRVDAGGVPQWTADGVALCTASGPQAFPAIATDGAGGAFVAWADRRDGIEDFVYAQRIDAGGAPAFASDGITPALVSLVGVTASPDRVRIVWYVADTGVRATVYRTSDGAGWSAIGESLADGTGRIRYEDDRV